MKTKQDAIDQIILLMQRYSISPNEIEKKIELTEQPKSNFPTTKFLSYIGAIFILCGVGIYISQHWNELTAIARIMITFGIGIMLLLLAILGSYDHHYSRMITPLYIIAVIFETSGIFVILNELFHMKIYSESSAIIVYGIMFIQQTLLFLKDRLTLLLFTSILFGITFAGTLFDVLGMRTEYIEVIMGALTIFLAYRLTATRHQALSSFWYLLGSILFLYGMFDLLQHTFLEIFYLALCGFFIYMSTLTSSKMLLCSGTVAMIGYISYYTNEHFVNSIGWPISLMMVGFIILGISVAAIKIGKTIKN